MTKCLTYYKLQSRYISNDTCDGCGIHIYKKSIIYLDFLIVKIDLFVIYDKDSAIVTDSHIIPITASEFYNYLCAILLD